MTLVTETESLTWTGRAGVDSAGVGVDMLISLN